MADDRTTPIPDDAPDADRLRVTPAGRWIIAGYALSMLAAGGILIAGVINGDWLAVAASAMYLTMAGAVGAICASSFWED